MHSCLRTFFSIWYVPQLALIWMLLTCRDSILRLCYWLLTYLLLQRQSALKKKHDELLSGGRRGAESESRAVLGNAELPFRRNDEVSGLILLSWLKKQWKLKAETQ